jgi:hypothetical protein
MMRVYSQAHPFYCGIDLHARTMHLCVLDQGGTVVLDKNLAARPETFLKAVAPFRDGLVQEQTRPCQRSTAGEQ